MREQITISVTAEDIAKGHRCNCWHCPIAEAASRLDGVAVAAVSSVLTLDYLDRRDNWPLTDAAMDFIEDFDAGCVVKPTEFTLYRIIE